MATVDPEERLAALRITRLDDLASRLRYLGDDLHAEGLRDEAGQLHDIARVVEGRARVARSCLAHELAEHA